MIVGGINYIRKSESQATLLSAVSDEVGQTLLPESQEQINDRSYKLSDRNGANFYLLPTNVEKLYLNFIGQKLVVSDTAIKNIVEPEFEYFVELDPVEPELFTLLDGEIFRCVSDDSSPKSKEDYTYYIMSDGEAKVIPNYKTLEVMLAERGLTLLSVKVLEKSLCDQLPKSNNQIPDKKNKWKSEYEDITSLEALRQLEENAQSATAIVEEAKESANSQIEAVKAAEAAAQAQAQAAQQQAATAQEQAKQAIAEAEAAKAEAEAAEAEFELKQKEIESQNQ